MINKNPTVTKMFKRIGNTVSRGLKIERGRTFPNLGVGRESDGQGQGRQTRPRSSHDFATLRDAAPTYFH